jgi:hypothetical protein
VEAVEAMTEEGAAEVRLVAGLHRAAVPPEETTLLPSTWTT